MTTNRNNIVPSNLVCNITAQLFLDPIQLRCGVLIERQAAIQAISTNQNNRCPYCRERTTAEELNALPTDQHTINAIQAFFRENEHSPHIDALRSQQCALQADDIPESEDTTSTITRVSRAIAFEFAYTLYENTDSESTVELQDASLVSVLSVRMALSGLSFIISRLLSREITLFTYPGAIFARNPESSNQHPPQQEDQVPNRNRRRIN